jgi:hypothetical protein
MFSEVQIFFSTHCSFDVDCDPTGKPRPTKKIPDVAIIVIGE